MEKHFFLLEVKDCVEDFGVGGLKSEIIYESV